MNCKSCTLKESGLYEKMAKGWEEENKSKPEV